MVASVHEDVNLAGRPGAPIQDGSLFHLLCA